MILSVSRRTDIPAFYSEWFFNRLKEGFVYVINPFNERKVSKVELNKETVDLFVFWTKDAEPMLKRLDELNEFKYYFQFTITSYRNDVERMTRKKKDIIDTFRILSKKIGKEKIIWRYDPIFLNDFYTKEYHYRWFERFCDKLEGYTDKCIISFLDLYKKTEINTRCLNIHKMDEKSMRQVAKQLSIIANKHNIIIETCSEGIDLSDYGIKKGSCIDKNLISKIIDFGVELKKDNNQRELCGCVKSVDIGQYNTCKHHCLYCYANFNEKLLNDSILKYNPKAPTLAYTLKGDEKITVREMESIKGNKQKQLDLFKNIKQGE